MRKDHVGNHELGVAYVKQCGWLIDKRHRHLSNPTNIISEILCLDLGSY